MQSHKQRGWPEKKPLLGVPTVKILLLLQLQWFWSLRGAGLSEGKGRLWQVIGMLAGTATTTGNRLKSNGSSFPQDLQRLSHAH